MLAQAMRVFIACGLCRALYRHQAIRYSYNLNPKTTNEHGQVIGKRA